MTDPIQPKPAGFWLRLAAANLASTIGFVPFYLLLIWISFAPSLGPKPFEFQYWLNAPRLILVIQILILLGVLVFGYPIERWVQRAGSTRFRQVAPYLVLSMLIFLMGIAMAFTRVFGWFPLYLTYGAPVMAATSAIGRLIYEQVLSYPKAIAIFSAVLATICLIGAVQLSTVTI